MSNVSVTKPSTEDVASLEQLNKDCFNSDQFSDAKRFGEFLAEDFISQFPHLLFVRPSQTEGAAVGAAKALTAMGLFSRQSPAFFAGVTALASAADAAQRA